MEFSRNVTELVRMRSSRRSYTSRPVEQDKLERLEGVFASLRGPFAPAARFRILDTQGWADSSINALGTYGTIRGARLYMAGAVERAERDMETYGYLFETVILHATDMDLGTCWIGGIFNRSGFADKMGVAEHEIVPAVSPLGYATEKRSLADSVIRWSAGSKSRMPWPRLFSSKDFSTPLSDDTAAGYTEVLEMVRLGPSASNRQPWRIVMDRDRSAFHLFLQRSKGYDKLITAVDLQRIDMGIAMCHFELTAREKGLAGTWEAIDPQPDVGPLPERTGYVVSWIKG
jgi:nitroreductase